MAKKAEQGSIHDVWVDRKNAKMEQQKEHVKKTVDELRIQRTLHEQSVRRDIEVARRVMQRKPVNASQKRDAFLKLRTHLGYYWYTNTMLDNMELLETQMELARSTAEFAKAMEEVTNLTRTYVRQPVNIEGLTRRFLKTIKPLNDGYAIDLGKANDEMGRAARKAMGADDYSDAMLQGIIEGKMDWMSVPAMDADSDMDTEDQPAAPAPAQQISASSSDDELLAELRRMTEALRGE